MRVLEVFMEEVGVQVVPEDGWGLEAEGSGVEEKEEENEQDSEGGERRGNPGNTELWLWQCHERRRAGTGALGRELDPAGQSRGAETR